MKKAVNRILVITLTVLIIDWCMIGTDLLNGDYDFLGKAYTAAVCFVVLFGCILYRIFSNKCPHCGKARMTNGSYCSYCGRKID